MEVVLRVTGGPHEGLEKVCHGQGSFLVGRSSHASCSMPGDRLLSREHFLIEVNPPLCDLTDLESTNGCKVNGLRVEKVRLRDGDVITAGESTFAIDVIGDARGDLRRSRCPGCGVPAPPGVPLLDGFGPWLCHACEAAGGLSRGPIPTT